MNLIESFKTQIKPQPQTLFEKEQVKAFALVESQGFPTKKNENWKYTSLREVSQKNFLTPSLSQCEVRSEVPVKNLETVYETLKNKIQTTDVFANINLAALTHGFYLEIPRNTDLETPIEIDQYIKGNEYGNVLIYIKVQENSHIRIKEFLRVQTGFLNTRLVFDLGAQSSCEHLRIYNKPENEGSFIFSATETHQARSSRYKIVQLGEGEKLLRQNIDCHLEAEGAGAEVYGYTSVQKCYAIDNFISTHHWAPHTSSRQLFKTILNEQTHSVFQGRIFIDKDAQKSDADQLSKHLVLSESCKVDAKPQLDVYADDVKATHGAAIGQLDKEELFYLESRGLSKDQALKILISAYGLEIIEKIENGLLKNTAQDFFKSTQGNGL